MKDNEKTRHLRDRVSKVVAREKFLFQRSVDVKVDIQRLEDHVRSDSDRLVNLRLENFDRLIDLEIFLLKILIPAFGISLTTRGDLLGIDFDYLRLLSFYSILFVAGCMIGTFFIRTAVIDSEAKKLKKLVDHIREKINSDTADIMRLHKEIIAEADDVISQGGDLELIE